ncbi:MAG: TetR/AcrR family transcriptional regulator [Ignavibacteriales bacterium]|nr:TetR/AcrR family transcriptional regulator [Ignavibacteriales bacterium]
MRKKEGNKETAIIEAAVRVFAENGYHQSKISKIAEVAGVATGSVYLYYKSKEDIVLKIFDLVWMKLSKELQQVVQRTDMDPGTKLDSIIDILFDSFTVNPALAIVFVNEQNQLLQQEKGNVVKFYKGFLDLAEEILREGVEKGIFNTNIDIRLFRDFVTGGLRALLHEWARRPEEYPLNRIRQNIKYIAKNGILIHHT